MIYRLCSDMFPSRRVNDAFVPVRFAFAQGPGLGLKPWSLYEGNCDGGPCSCHHAAIMDCSQTYAVCSHTRKI
jgi:hypothetical protein